MTPDSTNFGCVGRAEHHVVNPALEAAVERLDVAVALFPLFQHAIDLGLFLRREREGRLGRLGGGRLAAACGGTRGTSTGNCGRTG